jgi:DNA-binding transcriptional ArsR family regulator
VRLTLSDTQVAAVVRAASWPRAPAAGALDGSGSGSGSGTGFAPGLATLAAYSDSELSERRLSRSLVRGLAVLAQLHAHGGEQGIVELALELGLSPSTAHRYALTLVELGLVERCPRTRRYRVAGGGV